MGLICSAVCLALQVDVFLIINRYRNELAYDSRNHFAYLSENYDPS